MQSAPVLEIEEAAFRAWPAEEVVELSGWRLRFMHGVTRRANSVWPNGWHGETPLLERLKAVEAFAASRGIPPSFQLTSAARPSELDAALEARGYAIDAPVIVKTLELPRELSSSEGLGVQATVVSSPNADWLSVAVDPDRAFSRYRGRYEKARDTFLGMLVRLEGRAGFALARSNDEPVAIGLGVVDGPWLGIFGMFALPEARRRGAARSVLRALTAWGAERGARRAYLQVERKNDAARALYSGEGFVRAYDYHYRTKFSLG